MQQAAQVDHKPPRAHAAASEPGANIINNQTIEPAAHGWAAHLKTPPCGLDPDGRAQPARLHRGLALRGLRRLSRLLVPPRLWPGA